MSEHIVVKHIVVAVFVVEDQESIPPSRIRRQFELGYMSIYDEQGESFAYEPKSVSVTSVGSDLNIETEVY